jgi:signal transduction histidine kinase
VFLVVKEALNNIVKHANATAITLHLNTSDTGYILTIADNGKGICPPTQGQNYRGGNGVESMQQRMMDIGGAFRLESAEYEGTRVILTIPL